jgi:ribonuclease E
MEVGKINRFGVLVMTRQRIRPSLQHVNHETCPTCAGTGKVKTLEALTLSVVRRLHSLLAKGGIGEIRVKLAPVIATAVLNLKRHDLAQMEEESGARIHIQADWSMAYGEMTAELERSEEAPAEKPIRPPREKTGAPEDETVVLGGDSPISFDKALGETKEPRKDAFKYDRRDLQRAALDERERLRALFESARPEEEEVEEEAASEAETKEGGKRKRRRRRRKSGADRGAEGAHELPVNGSASEAQPEPLPEPPKATPDLVASLVTPSPRPRLGAAPAPASEPAPAPAKPKRTPRPKVAEPTEPAPAPIPEVAAPLETPARKVRTPRAKKAEAPVEPSVDAPPVKKPRTPRAKKPKAE